MVGTITITAGVSAFVSHLSIRVAATVIERHHAPKGFERLFNMRKYGLGVFQVGAHIVRTARKQPRSPC